MPERSVHVPGLRPVYRRAVPRKPPPSAYVEPAQSSAARRTVVNVFGTPRARDWRIPEDGTRAGLLAAQLQHDIARRLRDAISEDDAGNVLEFTRRHPEVTYDRLRGVLSGDLWMRLEDVAQLADLLGLEPEVSLREHGPPDR